MNRYWEGVTKNGSRCSEKEQSSTIASELKSLSLILNDKNIKITLPDNLEYVQAKTASADISNGICEIESRYIGFKLGSNIIKIRVNEKNSNISVELN